MMPATLASNCFLFLMSAFCFDEALVDLDVPVPLLQAFTPFSGLTSASDESVVMSVLSETLVGRLFLLTFFSFCLAFLEPVPLPDFFSLCFSFCFLLFFLFF